MDPSTGRPDSEEGVGSLQGDHLRLVAEVVHENIVGITAASMDDFHQGRCADHRAGDAAFGGQMLDKRLETLGGMGCVPT